MANIITLSRLILLYAVIYIAYQPPSWFQFLNVPLLIIMFSSDALDGYVARKRHESSLFGAMFDIASDRIVEICLWVVLAHLQLIAVWVPLLFITRGTIVDLVRTSESSQTQIAPFALMESAIAKWLVAGKFMRIFYAVIKAIAFCWLMFIHPMPDMLPNFWHNWSGLMSAIGDVFVWISVFLCLARGLPVVIEFVIRRKRVSKGRRVNL